MHSEVSDPIERVREIARDLIGCCSGARHEFEAELDELGVAREAKPSAAFDEIAFLCDVCGWYCSVDELNNEDGDELCDDCAADMCDK